MSSKDTSSPLLKKIVNLSDAREHIEGQQKLFEIEERYVPYSLYEKQNEEMNRLFSNTQKELKASNSHVERLATSLERLIPELTNKSIDHKEPMLRVGTLEIGEKADVAVVDGASVPSEVVYTIITSSILEKIGKEKFTASQLGAILKALKIKGDDAFHYERTTGKRSSVQLYKPNVIQELYYRLKNYEKYGITQEKSLKWQSYLKPESEVIQ
jgi:hypothetical protein